MTLEISQATCSGNPFLDELGIQVVRMADGNAEIALPLERRHMNSWNVVHGGVIMTLLDVAMSMAGRSCDPSIQGGVTVEMKTSFFQPGGKIGDCIVAQANVVHGSKTICFCEGSVLNDSAVVAKAMGTFKFLKRLDAGKKMQSDLSGR